MRNFLADRGPNRGRTGRFHETAAHLRHLRTLRNRPYCLAMGFSGCLRLPYSEIEGSHSLFLAAHRDGVLLAGTFDSYDGMPIVSNLIRLRPIDDVTICFADPNLERALQEVLALGNQPVTVAALRAQKVKVRSLVSPGCT